MKTCTHTDTHAHAQICAHNTLKIRQISNIVPEGSQWGPFANASFMLDTLKNKTSNVPSIRPAGQH